MLLVARSVFHESTFRQDRPAEMARKFIDTVVSSKAIHFVGGVMVYLRHVVSASVLTVALAVAALPLKAEENGLRTVPAKQGSTATLEKLDKAIKARGMKIFAHIDHQAGAKEYGLSMPASTVVMFGNPKAGTPIFLKKPTLAIDLPLKMLVWDDASGKTFVTYNTAEYVLGTQFARHGLKAPANVVAKRAKMLNDLATSAAN